MRALTSIDIQTCICVSGSPFERALPKQCVCVCLCLCSSPSSGGSQLTLASQWESRKVMTSPLAVAAPSRRVLISPSLFLVLRIRIFGIRIMYSSSATFRCSAQRVEEKGGDTGSGSSIPCSMLSRAILLRIVMCFVLAFCFLSARNFLGFPEQL